MCSQAADKDSQNATPLLGSHKRPGSACTKEQEELTRTQRHQLIATQELQSRCVIGLQVGEQVISMHARRRKGIHSQSCLHRCRRMRGGRSPARLPSCTPDTKTGSGQHSKLLMSPLHAHKNPCNSLTVPRFYFQTVHQQTRGVAVTILLRIAASFPGQKTTARQSLKRFRKARLLMPGSDKKQLRCLDSTTAKRLVLNLSY